MGGLEKVKSRTEKPEFRQKPEHYEKVNESSNPPKFKVIVRTNAQAKLQ